MKVEVTEVSTVKKILQVEIPNERVTKELDNTYKTLKKTAKLKVLSVSALLGEAIKRIHDEESVSCLFD